MFRFRIMLFLALGCLFWPTVLGAAQDELDAWSVDHFRQALEAQKARAFDQAVVQYQAVIGRNPRFAEAFLNLGIVYQLQTNYPDSVRSLQQAVKLKPTLIAAQVLLGVGQYMVQDFRSAHRTLETAIQQNPKERQAGIYLGLTLIGENQPEAAARQLRQVSEYFPDSIDISYYLGLAYTEGVKMSARVLQEAGHDSALYHWALALSADQKNDPGSALIDCLQGLAIDPNIPQLYTLAASLFEKAGFPDLARDAESRLRGSSGSKDDGGSVASAADRKKDYIDLWIKLGPLHPNPALPHVADTFIDQLASKEIAADGTGSLKTALELYEKAEFRAAELSLQSGPTRKPRPWIFAYLQARCEMGVQNFEAAELLIESALKEQLNVPSVALLKLEIQSELALRAYSTVISKRPESNAARLLQAKSLAASNNPDQAIEVYQEALRIQPGLPEIHLAIAQLEADRLNWALVIEEIQKELAISAENSLAVALLAHAYAETDQGKEAIPLLKKVLTRYPDDADALADLGKSLTQQGDRRSAIEAYEKALAADRSRYRIHYRLFQLYQSTGQTDVAERHLTIFQAEDAQRRAKATVIR